MSEECYTMKDGTFIPMCMGAAARGKDYCTCKTMTKAELRQQLAAKEKELAELREQITDNHKRAEEIIAARERQIERLREELQEEHELYIESCKNTAIQKSVRHELEQQNAELRKKNEELKQSEYWDLIQVRGNLSIEPEQLKELRRDRERLDWLFKDDEPYIVYHHDTYNDYLCDRDDIDELMRAEGHIDQAISHSQTDGEGEGTGI